MTDELYDLRKLTRALTEALPQIEALYLFGSRRYRTGSPRESYGETFGWVASVSTSASAPSVGQARAEQATTAAINIIRLFMGAGHARDMRLAHSMSSSPANYHIVVEGDGKFDIWTTRKMPGALVEDNWYTTIRSLASAYW